MGRGRIGQPMNKVAAVPDNSNRKSGAQGPEKIEVTGHLARSDWEAVYLNIRALARSHGLDAQLVELKPAEQGEKKAKSPPTEHD